MWGAAGATQIKSCVQTGDWLCSWRYYHTIAHVYYMWMWVLLCPDENQREPPWTIYISEAACCGCPATCSCAFTICPTWHAVSPRINTVSLVIFQDSHGGYKNCPDLSRLKSPSAWPRQFVSCQSGVPDYLGHSRNTDLTAVWPNFKPEQSELFRL